MLDKRDTRKELMDGDTFDSELAAASYGFIRNVNRWFGGIAAAKKYLRNILAGVQFETPLRILDIGAGECDIPLALNQWLALQGIPCQFTCIESAPEACRRAKQILSKANATNMEVIEGDVFLHQPEQPHHIALASMVLHHFSEESIHVLAEHLRGCVSYGFLINDLRRSRIAYAATRILTATKHPGVRHDALLSIRKGFTVKEMVQLLQVHNSVQCTVRNAPLFRICADVRFTNPMKT